MRIFFSLNKKQLKKKNFAYTCSVRKNEGKNDTRASETKNTSYVFAPIGKQPSTRSADPIATSCGRVSNFHWQLVRSAAIVSNHSQSLRDVGRLR